MELRYLGFEQRQKSRAYRFTILEKGEPPRHVEVTADLALFLAHHVGIQEGPSLCARKLTADLQISPQGTHELCDQDLTAHVAARSSAEARRAELRKAAPRRAAKGAQQNSPWRNFGL